MSPCERNFILKDRLHLSRIGWQTAESEFLEQCELQRYVSADRPIFFVLHLLFPLLFLFGFNTIKCKYVQTLFCVTGYFSQVHKSQTKHQAANQKLCCAVFHLIINVLLFFFRFIYFSIVVSQFQTGSAHMIALYAVNSLVSFLSVSSLNRRLRRKKTLYLLTVTHLVFHGNP